MKIEVDEFGGTVIKEAYDGVIMETDNTNKIAICMRDNTFEISVIIPNGNSRWHRVDMQSGTIEEFAIRNCMNVT